MVTPRQPGARLQLSDFEFSQATFELRFERAFALWDHAGGLANTLVTQFPAAKLQEGNPGRISFTLSPNVEFSFELDKAHVILHSPKRTAEDFTPLASSLSRLLTTNLGIKVFSRVGTRAIYRKDYGNVRDATERVVSLGHLKIPDGKFFGLEESPETVSYAMRWSGKATGIRVSLLTQTQKIEFAPAPVYSKEVTAIDKERHDMILDIDYFSTAPVTVEQLHVDEWVKNLMHMINRDIPIFMKA